jgi:protein TonB
MELLRRMRMTERATISPPCTGTGQPRATAMATRHRFWWIAGLLSVGAHLIAALLVVFLPRVLPREAGPQEQGAVELLMVEQKGAQPSQAGQPRNSKPAQSPPEKTVTPQQPATPQTVAPKAAERKDAPPVPVTKPVPAPAMAPGGDEPSPAPSDQVAQKSADQVPPKPAAKDQQSAHQQADAQPTPPQTQAAPVFDLAGTDSDSNAVVMGDRVLPAMPDDRFRNRPPVYPIEAQLHNEYGSVVVMIHVAANGLATGADVMQTSGVDLLDQAALTAVRKWHFRPAMKEGHAVPFDFPFRFVFEPK